MPDPETPDATVDRERERPEKVTSESLRAAAIEAAYILEAIRT